MMSDLTLNWCIDGCRSEEVTSMQMKSLSEPTDSVRQVKSKWKKSDRPADGKLNVQSKKITCKFCGYEHQLEKRSAQHGARGAKSINRWTIVPTRSSFSERNGVSFPERYSKSEKGRGFDILCMRRHGVRGIRANAPLCTALICSVVRGWGFSARWGLVLNLL